MAVLSELRGECLNVEWFRTRREASIVIEAWRRHYNAVRPHSSLDYLTPLEFSQQHRTQPQIPNRAAFQESMVRGTRAGHESVRGEDPEHVFVYRGRPIGTMHNTAWQSARERAGLPHVRVHDLKHTFGRRLRAAGVSFEDRQDLLGHRSGRITTHYSEAELQNLLEAANKVCGDGSRKSPGVVLLKKRAPTALRAVSA